ncbi:MAG: hypothetical protein JJT82_00520 [Legionellaceae bacterium]|nr:hypothetical protein [Legionellaceae bacterium]
MFSKYERPNRFKSPCRAEVLHELINKIDQIIGIYSSGSTNYFSNSGKISQHFGLKKYSDQRISNLKALFSEKEFKEKPHREQYELINQALQNVKLSSFKKHFVNINPNITDFINAVKSEDNERLDEILLQITPKMNDTATGILNFFSYITQPVVKREECLYTKEQVVSAAYWWRDVLKNEIPKIIADHNQYHKTAIEPPKITPMQEKVFTTTLADLIWEICQTPHLNMGEQSHLYVSYDSKFIDEALDKAKIKFTSKKELNLLIIAFVCPGGITTFQLGRGNTGDIYCPNKKKYSPNLPKDEVMQFRDTLGTLTSGKSNDSSQINWFSLPYEIMEKILIEAKPEKLSVKKAKQQISWNQQRMISLRGFFHTIQDDKEPKKKKRGCKVRQRDKKEDKEPQSNLDTNHVKLI